MSGAGGYYRRKDHFEWPQDRIPEVHCGKCGKLLTVRFKTSGDGQLVEYVDPCERCVGRERKL